MAIGAITRPSTRSGDSAGNAGRVRTRDVVLTSGANYTTGGSPIVPSAVGLRTKITAATVGGRARLATDSSTSIPVAFAFQTDGSVKLVAYVASTGAEQSSNADLSTFTVRVTFGGS